MNPLKNLSIPKLFLLTALALAVLIAALVYMTFPGAEEKIEDSRWCIKEFTINDTAVQTRTLGISLQFGEDCNGNLYFDGNTITFPGLNSYAGSARWTVDGDELRIDGADSSATIFEGTYLIRCDWKTLHLESDRITITAERVEFNLPF
jgi:hypothetical protein